MRGVRSARKLLLMLLLAAGTQCRLIIEPPEVLLQGSPSLPQTSVQFTCQETQPNISNPRRDIVWLKDGDPLDFLSTEKYTSDSEEGRLLVLDLSEEDMGVYQCAHAIHSVDRGSATLWISPYIVYAPPTQILRAHPGEVQTIECIVSSGNGHIQWAKDGQTVAISNGTTLLNAISDKYGIFPNGSLLIRNVEEADKGLYSCMVYNKAGNDTASIKLTQNDCDNISAPAVGCEDDIAAVPGSTAGSLRNTTAMPETSSNKNTVGRESSLRKDDVIVPDAGKHNCVTIEDYRFGQGPTISIRIQAAPVASRGQKAIPFNLTASPSCVQSVEGYSIVLTCITSGLPSPTTRWLRGSSLVTTLKTGDARLRQLTDGSLLISTLLPTDLGNYTCQVNSSGVPKVSWVIALKVWSSREVCGYSEVDPLVQAQGGNPTPGMAIVPGARTKRIYGGRDVAGASKWPWQVLLEFPSLQGSTESLCGGALVKPDLVLTAAHCVSNLSPQDISVRVGVFNRSAQEPSQQRLPVKAIYINNNFISYLQGSKPGDIAVLRLGTPAQLTQSVGLVCLPTEEQDPAEQTMCVVTGWGHKTEDSATSSVVLQEAEVPLVSDSQCKKAYSPFIRWTWMCAGYANGTQDACQNDSGGPLVCRAGTQWTEYGIVISGAGCGRPNKYGIYTRVTRFVNWIQNMYSL